MPATASAIWSGVISLTGAPVAIARSWISQMYSR